MQRVPMRVAAMMMALMVVLVGCGGEEFDQAAAEADIRETMATFLDTDVSPEDKVDELELGDQLMETLQAGADSAGVSTKAEVTEITFSEDNEQAEVAYEIIINDETRLPNTAIVVNVDGDWKLSALSYCDLIAAGGGECPEGIVDQSKAEIDV